MIVCRLFVSSWEFRPCSAIKLFNNLFNFILQLSKVKWLKENVRIVTGANGHVAHAVCSATIMRRFVKVVHYGTTQNVIVCLWKICVTSVCMLMALRFPRSLTTLKNASKLRMLASAVKMERIFLHNSPLLQVKS